MEIRYDTNTANKIDHVTWYLVQHAQRNGGLDLVEPHYKYGRSS